MRVKELIELLQKEDPELEVFLRDSEYGPDKLYTVEKEQVKAYRPEEIELKIVTIEAIVLG